MKPKTFSGGYAFKGFKGQPQAVLIEPEIPRKVIIPLSQGFGGDPKPIVKVGDSVYAGQIIGRDDTNISSPVHASISGTVKTITKMNYFKRHVIMIVIEGGGEAAYQALEGYSPQWTKLSPEKIEELLYKSGVTSLDREGIPTHFKTSIIMPEEVEDLIVHGVGSELYNSSLDVLLKGKELFGFVDGIKILKRIMPHARVHLALNAENKAIIERIKKLTSSFDNFNIYPTAPKYPQGYDEVLVPTLLGKKFPYGYSAANIGIVVLNTQAVLSAFKAVTEGKPLIDRIISLCGPSFREAVHIKVRIGTPLEHILKGRIKDVPSRVVLNSLLTGTELNNLSLPVDRTFSQLVALPEDAERKLLAFTRPGLKSDSYSNAFISSLIGKKKTADTNWHGEKRPCIQCGYCISVCPVKIIPTLLDRYISSGISEILMKYEIFNCIDCNLCSYVCPSKIPLAKNLKTAKAKLIESGCDHSLCILPKFNLKGLEQYKGIKVTK